MQGRRLNGGLRCSAGAIVMRALLRAYVNSIGWCFRHTSVGLVHFRIEPQPRSKDSGMTMGAQVGRFNVKCRLTYSAILKYIYVRCN